MKVYCVWGWDQYYPTGPGDLKGIYTDLDQALAVVAEMQKAEDRLDYIRMTTEKVQGV